MKILIIIGSFKVGGAERMSISTGEELTRRGHDVHYIVQRPIFEIPNSIPKNKIHVLRKKDRNKFSYKVFALLIGVYREAKNINPDIIIGFSRFSSFLANFTFHSKIIARMDAFPYRMSWKQRLWANIVVNSPLVKKVVVPSSGMLSAFEKVKPRSSNKFILIPNSINASSILKKIRSNKAKAPFDFNYISAMGRFSPQKNFQLLINAYAKSSIKDKFKLVIIGSGPYEDKLMEKVKEQKLENYIVFTGKLSNPFTVIHHSKFFVNPSKFESFGNVILEALLLGKPVLATNCKYGPADMIKNQYNGALIADDNLDEMVEKLNEWGKSESLMNTFSKNANASAMDFDVEEIGQIWEKLIKSLE